MDDRQRLCRNYGATHILDPREGDVAQGVRDITDGVGADVIFDAAGVEKAIIGAIPACRVQGTIVNIAVWEKSPSIPVNELMYKEVRYVGAALYDETSFLETIRAVNDGNCTLFDFTLIPFKVVGWFNATGFRVIYEQANLNQKI